MSRARRFWIAVSCFLLELFLPPKRVVVFCLSSGRLIKIPLIAGGGEGGSLERTNPQLWGRTSGRRAMPACVLLGALFLIGRRPPSPWPLLSPSGERVSIPVAIPFHLYCIYIFISVSRLYIYVSVSVCLYLYCMSILYLYIYVCLYLNLCYVSISIPYLYYDYIYTICLYIISVVSISIIYAYI